MFLNVFDDADSLRKLHHTQSPGKQQISSYYYNTLDFTQYLGILYKNAMFPISDKPEDGDRYSFWSTAIFYEEPK
jgi:hypothetical protein